MEATFQISSIKGLCQLKKSPKIRSGSGWASPGLTRKKVFENRPKLAALIFWSSIPCVFCLNIHLLLKVGSYYDLCVLSMSVIG